MLWAVLMIALIAYQILAILRLNQQHIHFFHSRTEMLLAGALVLVLLFGIVLKSRENSR